MLYIGLISGTSADGIDAALVRIVDHQCTLLASITHPWDDGIRRRLIDLGQGGSLSSLEELGTLDVSVGEAFATATHELLASAGVDAREVKAIGSHGQTIRHRPNGALDDGAHPFTMQIGDANIIAERTHITTVADFRRRDLAAGGQGAPLVPAFHADVLASSDENRAILNLGGIANFTLLPVNDPVRGFDTGPANALMDAWCLEHTGRVYDEGGAFASTGSVDAELLARFTSEPWFALPPPKSTGREQFHLDWVRSQLTGNERPEDVQATLLALTAQTVADALHANQPQTSRVLVCGGGVHNDLLMSALRRAMPQCIVESTAVHGLDPDAVEAMAFAWLAMRTMQGLPGNVPAVTGAQGPRVLGAIYPA